MTKKTCKKPTKTSKTRGKIKGRFELAPSRQPLRHKALWELEDSILSELMYSHITRGLYSMHPTLFTELYSDEYNWLDYSSLLYYIYEVRSLKAYPNIRKLGLYKDILSNQVSALLSDFKKYYSEDLGKDLTKIKKSNLVSLENTCAWLVFHINRNYSYNHLGLKLSYWVNFYTEVQEGLPDNEKIGGTYVKRLVDFLVYKGKAQLYKGYKLKSNYRKSFTGGSYGGDTKSCMSMLILDYEKLEKYLNINHKFKKSCKSFCYPKEQVTNLYEIRKESKSKEVIPMEDYPDNWLDKVHFTKEVMQTHSELLGQSMVSLGKYQIPEIHFKRIWIGSVDVYGRIHDTGEFQTKSKKLREQILIDQERTVTIDLSAIHPRILYTLEGVELPADFDPYPELDIKLDNTRVRRFKKFYNIEKYNPLRNLAKVALLILINANSYQEARAALECKVKSDNSKLMTRRECEMGFVGIPASLDFDKVLDTVMSHNFKIKKYFSTGISLSLMNRDSDIILDTIDTLNNLGIVCLPLHDSVTVSWRYEEEAKSALAYGYKSVMGTLMNFKCEVE